ncbi:hypothetical protein SAMN02745163_03897 [Clostridium cavendishii DSM 21758]|uniref:Permease n=1 Tax=Clostridium cavendishii DSM 21758 TaxID=1121302 RepID=A0A1M6SVX6_9CLOT|nr:permease [Clostridium cavendishii]SHK48864.1 hypothetical protein SAMN02745163_03897 [Clostridium cavendishii DSM 21758]
MGYTIEIITKFALIFSSIMIEAIPFILIGAMLSAFMQTFLTEEILEKAMPKNPLVGSLAAGLIGLIFPICECAAVPITRGLIKKGVPMNIAVTYMLAAPIINPLVILSTYYAFNGNAKVVGLRVLLGFVISVATGLIMLVLQKNNDFIKDDFLCNSNMCTCGCNTYGIRKSKLNLMINHGIKELYDIGKYFIIGAALAALFQVFVPKEKFLLLGTNPILGVVIMLLFAFFVSLCSEADAFVASAFLGSFSFGAVMGFLLLGPMVDLKNTLMLFSTYKKTFVFKLIFVVFSLCFIASCFIW